MFKQRKEQKGKKYAFVGSVDMVPRHWDTISTYKFYRIKALRDISLYGVKAGDLGGLITAEVTLSHEGSSWVGYDATVNGTVHIQDDSYVGDHASVSNGFPGSRIIIRDRAVIKGNAYLKISKYSDEKDDLKRLLSISDNVVISGNAILENTLLVNGGTNIGGFARIGMAQITRDSQIFGDVNVENKAVIVNSILSGNVEVKEGAKVTASTLYGDAVIEAGAIINGGTFGESAIYDTLKKPTLTKIILDSEGNVIDKELPPIIEEEDEDSVVNGNNGLSAIKGNNAITDFLDEIIAKMQAYETDIVRIIKYPTMTDRSDPTTSAMTKALNKVMRLTKAGNQDGLEEAVDDLETKFLAAESNAIKMAATMLSDADYKKAMKAKDLLGIASNEASTENEKKVAFIQGFKQLEGIITVPEEAKDAFRVLVGLKEIEA